MNELWGHVIGVFIVVLTLTFIGIWVWAWLPHHRKNFDALAHLPMHDEDESR
ncbi:MAG TPA: cbb3-type cytochrome c oxidase subunit 3 [Povalibacter sp.]|uniref:cbb3-type cytochrome oxidase subunit 3 n=1 Tax=Povalibacter sp. TaxID=1962978 RepID=UPI002C9C2CF5|nr:cbb3-type cytochrome c oxidase subunit 3 [Povalibacter sp.]HMN43070.1 cbb3-type cytochrome c oxidase subunit 3 [Povalibacter sp.]